MVNMVNMDDLLESIWNEVEFESVKSEEKFKKDNVRDVRRVHNDNYYVANCKICNVEIKLSCHYNGEFPLCQIHRDPNHRLKRIKK